MVQSKRQKNWMRKSDKYVNAYKKEMENMFEAKRIWKAKASGIKNPYFNFINNLPDGLTKLANKSDK